MGFLKEFKAFALKGNVVDMAVGVIIGGAFGKIVTSLVNDILMPPIGMLLGVPAAAATYALLKEATDKRETHLKTQEKEQMGNSHKQNIS